MYTMGLERIFHTASGRIIVSVLLGLGLSTLLRKECNWNEEIVLNLFYF
jgi:hypothetical protein